MVTYGSNPSTILTFYFLRTSKISTKWIMKVPIKNKIVVHWPVNSNMRFAIHSEGMHFYDTRIIWGKCTNIWTTHTVNGSTYNTSDIWHSTNWENYSNHIHTIHSINMIIIPPYPIPIQIRKLQHTINKNTIWGIQVIIS